MTFLVILVIGLVAAGFFLAMANDLVGPERDGAWWLVFLGCVSMGVGVALSDATQVVVWVGAAMAFVGALWALSKRLKERRS